MMTTTIILGSMFASLFLIVAMVSAYVGTKQKDGLSRNMAVVCLCVAITLAAFTLI